MGAPESGIEAAQQPTAETLLSALRTIKPAERARHGRVLDYWLSIRGDKEFPPLHDLDPLELSDAGPSSILLELIGGGQDAEVRHLGDALADEAKVQRIIDAPNPSVLASIAKKLPIVAISRDFLAFEESFGGGSGSTRCWVTLLPLSSCGSWVDYVYAFVSVETVGTKAVKPVEAVEAADEAMIEEAAAIDVTDEVEEAPDETPAEAEAVAEPLGLTQASEEPEAEELTEPSTAKGSPGFSKLLEGVANLAGFYGQGVKVVDPVVETEFAALEAVAEPQPDVEAEAPFELEEAVAVEPEPAVEPEVPLDLEEQAAVEPETVIEDDASEAPLELEQPASVPEPVAEESPVQEVAEELAPEEVASEKIDAEPEPAPAMEGSLQGKLDEVQAKADEARQAQLRATQALHEGLSAAYDFALDAENSPEEYLRMVEAQGLKIQLRAPMAPVAKLAFDGVCDAATIRQFEAVLAWALKVELPRGALLERIEQAGGIPELLNEFAKAA